MEDWNRLRKGKSAVNRIDVIELRTDAKYGKFIKHEPAKVRIKVTRKNAKVVVEILDFISPTIIERLQQQAGILQPKIDDWRAMVDCVMIDPAYDGNILNVALDDIPADGATNAADITAASDKVKPIPKAFTKPRTMLIPGTLDPFRNVNGTELQNTVDAVKSLPMPGSITGPEDCGG